MAAQCQVATEIQDPRSARIEIRLAHLDAHPCQGTRRPRRRAREATAEDRFQAPLPEPSLFRKDSLVYSKAGARELWADLYRPSQSGEGPAPIQGDVRPLKGNIEVLERFGCSAPGAIRCHR